MAFRSGLHNRVILYPKAYQKNERTDKDQLAHSLAQADQVVCCRIIHEEKALFAPDVTVASGDRLRDLQSNKLYEILAVREVYGKESLHHYSCDLRKWGLDDGRHTHKH